VQRELPEGWELVDLKDFVFFQEGPGIRKWQFRKSGIKLLNVANLVNGSLNLDKTDRHVDKDEVAQKYQHFLLDPEDIVMASSGVTWGKTAVISKEHLPLMLNTSNIRLRTLDEKKLDKKFLRIFLDSRLFKKQIDKLITGSAQPNFGSSHLKQVKLLLPPLTVQRQIVAVLEQAEAVKRQRHEADALTVALLQSVFLEMFGDPMRNEKRYPKKKLGDACLKIQDGTHYSPEDQTGEIPYITAKNIRRWGIDLSTATYVPKHIHEKIYSRCDPKKGDVIYIKDGVTAGLAKVNTFNFEFSMLSSIAMIRPDTKTLNPFYLEHYLNHPNVYEKIMERKSGSAITRIILREIREIPLILPPLPLQQQFARVVERVERIREQQVASGWQIEGLCEGLMQRAFAGELIA
jgi:type I restriction enzyme, S subunit